jgi:hypothetical protein
MPYFVIIFVFLLSLNVSAQTNTISEPKPIICVPETQPIFINGGEKGMMKVLMADLHLAKCTEVESGKAIIDFVVLENGAVDSVNVQGGWCEDMRQVLKKTVQEFKFVPGTQAGKPVKVRYKIPIACIKPN